MASYKKDLETKKKQKSNYGWWLFRKHKTLATAKELWNKPKVRMVIQAHNESVKQNKSKK